MEGRRINRSPEQAGSGSGGASLQPGETKESALNRRQMLGRAATGGVIAALAALWAPGGAVAADEPVEGATVAYDVAVLGHTFVRNDAEALDLAGGDLRGMGFSIEGDLYAAGTIPAGDGFDPASTAPLGHWFCRGWFIAHPARPRPVIISTQEFLFGRISDEQPTPPDQLVSSGLEAGIPVAIRSVIGGTGRYRGARGEVVQQAIGTNLTINRVAQHHAMNYRFHFRI